MISDEAVEAAARETYRVAAEFAYESDSWDDLSDGQREAFAEDARKILEAAAPYMLAAAKAEALEDAIEWLRIPSQPHGGFAAGWLKIRAKEYRNGNL